MQDELYLRKLQAEITYLKLEKDYLQKRYQTALQEFNSKFQSKIEKENKNKVVNKEETKNKNLDGVYKKLAVKVHPDKKTGSKKEFQRLTKLIKENDLDGLKSMAKEYDVEVNRDLDIPTCESMVDGIKTQIKSMKETIAYQWKYGNKDTVSKIESFMEKK